MASCWTGFKMRPGCGIPVDIFSAWRLSMHYNCCLVSLYLHLCHKVCVCVSVRVRHSMLCVLVIQEGKVNSLS